MIVKTGGTLAAEGLRAGDFEDWILAAMGLRGSDAVVADVQRGDPLPPPAQVRGIVITGSTSMVTERLPWSERTAAWLRGAVHAGVPVLGICYGHQLLAHALGGVVARNPRGREIGTIEVHLNEHGRADALLGGPHDPISASHVLRVQATHVESVVTLPEGALPLGHSAGDPHQTFRFGPCAWGVQFHPEFDAPTLRAYLRARAQLLAEEGLDAEALTKAACDSPHGASILRRFVALCESMGSPEPKAARPR